MVFVLVGISAHPVWLGPRPLVLRSATSSTLFPVRRVLRPRLRPDSANQCGGPTYWAYHLVLPWLTFALLFAAIYARMIRASCSRRWTRTTCGRPGRRAPASGVVLRKHILRNAMLPIVTMLGDGHRRHRVRRRDLHRVGLRAARARDDAATERSRRNDLPVIAGDRRARLRRRSSILNLIVDVVYACSTRGSRSEARRASAELRAASRRRPRRLGRCAAAPEALSQAAQASS